MDFFESPKLGVLMIGSLVSFLKHHQSVWMNAPPAGVGSQGDCVDSLR